MDGEATPPPARWAVALRIAAAVLAAAAALRLHAGRSPGLLPLASIEFQPDPALAARQVAGHAETVWRYTASWALLAVALALACHVGSQVLVSPSWRRVARGALIGAVAAGALAALETVLLLWYPQLWWPGRVGVVRAAQAMAFTRNCLVAVALPPTAGVLVVTAIRLYRSLRRSPARSWTLGADVIPRRRDGLRPGPDATPLPRADGTGAADGADAAGDVAAAAADGAAPGDRQPTDVRTAADEKVAGYVHEDLWLPVDRTLGGTGICVSGGGIRSACVALGALQALQGEGELQRADYLVSVSGGGYTAGAYQLALTDPSPKPGARGANPVRTEATPDDVLGPGSPEEDHVRRHSSYVADSAGDWAAALGTLLRGVLANLGLLAATVIAAGGLLHLFYRHTHVIALTELAPIHAFGPAQPRAPLVPAVQQGVATALVLALVATVLTFSIGLAAFASGAGGAQRVIKAGQALASLAIILTAFGVLLPLLLWATGRLTWSIGLGDRRDLAPAGIGTIVLTYLSAIVGILWRGRDRINKQVGTIRARLSGASGHGGARGVAGGLTQRVLVALALLVLSSVFLLLLGWTTTTAPRWSPVAWVVLAVTLVFFSVVLDQTWLGLHPFYRRRLATAFAVRRVDKQGLLRAQAYDYENEVTRLSEYGRQHDGFPQVIFAGTANLSGSELTPPGRRAVSYTFSHDWIGGPQVGWVRTATVDGTVLGHVSRDVTVQAAVAISGAAFASAMGGQARAYQTFFALSNARLGTWLPNPGHVADHLTRPRQENWTSPRLPRMRRLQYLLREIVGAYPDGNPLLFITDGGHYENLGLVELLRHRCTMIYCIDASGDSPPLAATLAQAITLAYEELGVTITLRDPYHLVAGGGEPLQPKEPLSGLSGRLSTAAVLTGRITYPARAGLPRQEGTLVVAKASLTADMPYEVLSYAQSNPVFPHDSTADQWFNVGQFDAYQAVGRHIGLAAVAARRKGEPQAASAAASPAASPPGEPRPPAAPAAPAAPPAEPPVRTSARPRRRRSLVNALVMTLTATRKITSASSGSADPDGRAPEEIPARVGS